MNRQALAAIGAMLNSFPQGPANPDLLIRTFEEDLRDIQDEIVLEIARRYRCAEVSEQSLDFAPSVAKFKHSCRKLIEARAAARAIPDGRVPIARAPISVRIQRERTKMAGREIIAENVEFMQFRSMAKNFPDGSEYSALLQTIFGPERRPPSGREAA